jgi:hypothetical protein
LRIPTNINVDGSGKITTNELLKNLGWNIRDINNFVQDADWWTNQTNAQILRLANRSPDGAPAVPAEVHYVTVEEVINGNSFHISERNIAPNGVVLGGVIAPEAILPGGIGSPDELLGQAARDYLERILIETPTAAGYAPRVALRINATNRMDRYRRLIAWVFHNVPDNMEDLSSVGVNSTVPLAPGSEIFRKEALTRLAGEWPQVEWDSFLSDGRPYTANWEMVVAGHANVDTRLFSSSVPRAGVEGAGL